MITIAQNSLIPRANIITAPLTMFRAANGIEMVKKTFKGELPRFNAACSSLSGTAENPSRAAFTKNGRLTNAIASTIPAGCPTKSIPKDEANLPAVVSLETSPSNAMPAAVCGITTGRSIMPSTSLFKWNFLRAKSHAPGKEMNAKIKVAVKDAEMVKIMLLVTCLSDVVSNKSESGVLNTIPAIGATMKSSISPKAAEIIKVNVLLCINTAKLDA